MDDMIEKQRKHFDDVAIGYYEARQCENHIELDKFIWNYFFKDKKYLAKKKMSVLEPMCGYANAKKIIEEHFLSPQDFSYEGFDYSDNLINKVKSINPDINVKVMDVTKYKADKQYDLIIILGGLHHVPDFAFKVLKEIRDSLKDDGYFINYEPTENNFIFTNIRKSIYRKNKVFDDKTEKSFELNELNSIYEKSGMKIVEQIYPGLLSYILWGNPDVFPFLNIGNKKTVRLLFNFDKLFFKNIIGRALSFSTLTLLTKKEL